MKFPCFNIIEKPATVWYMEINTPEKIVIQDQSFTIELQRNINIEEYIKKYMLIGDPWDWSGRLCMKRTELEKHLKDPKNEIYYCYHKSEFVGYFELDVHNQDIEIVYFGVVPYNTSKGFGKEMMNHVFKLTSLKKSTRVWLHTCEFDSPHAIPFYKRMGFKIYKQQTEIQKIAVR